MAAPGGEPSDDGFGDTEWELNTAALAEDYARLQVAVRGVTLPVVPIRLADTLVVAMPAEAAPWLEPALHPLADPATFAPAADGAQVALVVLRLASTGAAALEPCITAAWTADGRWPAAAGMDALPCPYVVARPEGGFALRDEALPPAEFSAGPIELNDAFAGALFDGPWAAYEHLVYPPAEPESEGPGGVAAAGSGQLPFVPPAIKAGRQPAR